MNKEIKLKLQQEKNATFVSEIRYKGKIYAKTIKVQEEGIEYVYYEIENGEIKELQGEEENAYLKKNYERNERGIYC